MAIGIVFVGIVAGLAAGIAALVFGATAVTALLAYWLGGTLGAGFVIVVQIVRQAEVAPSLATMAIKPTRY